MLARIRTYLRRRKYRPGAQLMRLVACDIRRDVEIVDASEVDDGYVTARVRTRNLLYQINLGAPIPDFAPPRRIAIEDLWKWTGEDWGGPVPDDDISRAR